MITNRNQPFTCIPDYWVNQFYKAAKANNEIAILELIKNPICINQHYQRQFLTPAGRLAAEGDIEAVALLARFGANVHWTAWGAAFGGQREFAEHLRKDQGASVNYFRA